MITNKRHLSPTFDKLKVRRRKGAKNFYCSEERVGRSPTLQAAHQLQMKEFCHLNKKYRYHIVFVLIMYLVMASVWGCKNKDDKSIDSIAKELPLGTSFVDVESYLKNSKYEYSYDEQTRCFTAILRNGDQKGFTTKNITLVIQMDEHDRLNDLVIKDVYTGP